MSKDDFFRIVAEQVLAWRYLARTKEDLSALDRLLHHVSAQKAWRTLWNKPLVKGDFWVVASVIGRHAITARLDQTQTKTVAEIKTAALDAVSCANKLIALICGNATLRVMGEDIIPANERDAINTASNVLFENLRNPHASSHGADTAAMRDAYRIFAQMLIFDDGFLERLRLFVETAKKSAECPPITLRPNVDSVSQHVFSNSLCNTLVSHYGLPNHDVVAELASAVFDTVVSTDTVKKWWQRQPKEVEGGVSPDEK